MIINNYVGLFVLQSREKKRKTKNWSDVTDKKMRSQIYKE